VPAARVAAGRLTFSRRSAEGILAVLVTAVWAATLLPLFDFATADTRLLDAFSVDELIQLNLLRAAASARTFALHFGPYGHFVFNIILIVLRALPGAATDARILYVGRTVNLAFGAAAVLLVFWWARRTYGAVAGWVAFSLMIVNTTLYLGVAQVQPDIAQLFLLMASLVCAARLIDDALMRWLVLSTALAGAAFACKYSGLFVLPIVIVALARRPVPVSRPATSVAVMRVSLVLLGAALFAASFAANADWIAKHLTEDGRINSTLPLHLTLLATASRGAGVILIAGALAPWPWNALKKRQYALAVLWSWSLALATFVAAFVVTSPYSLRQAAFVKGLLGEASFAAPVTLASQLATLRSVAMAVGWPGAGIGVATMAVLLWRARKRDYRVKAVDAVLIAWVFIYVVVLLLPAHEMYFDYALPLVPAFAMLAGGGIAAAFRRIAATMPMRNMVAAGALALVVAAAEAPLAAALIDARAAQLRRTTDTPQAYVAQWLQCRVPPASKIAYDYFVYVPSSFQNAVVTWGGTPAWLRSVDPDVVVVEVTTAAYAAEDAEHRAYYDCLNDGSCGYARELSRGDVIVYLRRGSFTSTARGCS